MPPKGHLPFDLHVLGLPLAFILSQDQTLHCKFDISFFFILCSRIYLLEIDKVVFRTLVLLPFRLCLDHSFKELRKTLSSLSARLPVVLRVQRYEKYLTHNTFDKLFFKNFHFFA